MSIRQGNKVLSAGQSLTQNLFDFKWADHILDDIQWLRADTFTWHDGRVYEAAYQHLLAEWNEVGDVPSTEIIAGTQIYYRLAPDGHKICSASQEDEAVAIYEATGIAWYYILDTTNQRFKLPRTKFGFVGLRDNDVGKYIPESLPNITGTAGGYIPRGYAGYTGVFTSDVSSAGASHVFDPDSGDYNRMKFDASRSSSVYQNNAPVQERSTQMYLYFFVGNFAQSAVVNTAGINATLIEEIQNNKQDVATAVNYNNISNCITHIPQDIKLTLSNGTLTLKAGSKVYVPNGAGVFDEVVRNSDLVYSFGTPANGRYLVFNSQYFYLLSNCVSGATDSKAGQAYHSWYDTTNNLIKQYWADGSTPARTDSLPVAIITISGGVITSIDQVFNGLGYIGSTVFALPGVKGLVPNGRNADGSLKNIEWVASQVITSTLTFGAQSYYFGVYNNNQELAFYGKTITKYDEKNNVIIDTYPDPDVIRTGWSFFGECVADSNSKITSFTSKTVFHAVDYNEADFVVGFQRPTAANNYTWYRKYKSGWVEQGIHGNWLKAASSYYSLASHVGMEIQTAFNLPIPLSQVAQANAEASGNSGVFCGDVYTINNGASVKCWIFNSNNDAIDASGILIHITVSGMAA